MTEKRLKFTLKRGTKMEFEFERQAMKNEPMPKKLDIADSCLYVALRCLYKSYHEGLISKTQGAEEKATLLYNWRLDKSKIEMLNRESSALAEKIGTASAEYAKNATIENADKLYAAFYNLSDDWRTA